MAAAKGVEQWEAVELTNGGAFALAAEVFRKYDADGSGALDKEELVAALTELGVLEQVGAKSAGRALEQQLREADANGDGKVSWKEFGTFFNRLAQLKASERRAGRLQAGRKVVVPHEIFSDPGVKAAFKHFTEHGKARGLGERVSSAKELQMTSQQFKRMLELTGLINGLGGSAAAADIIFARSRPAGATKLRYQAFLSALAMLAEESGVQLQQVVQQLVAGMRKQAPVTPRDAGVGRNGKGSAGASPGASRYQSPGCIPAIKARQPSAPQAPAPCLGDDEAEAALHLQCFPEQPPAAMSQPAGITIPAGPCASLLQRLGCIQQLLSSPTPPSPPSMPRSEGAGYQQNCSGGSSNSNSNGTVPAEAVELFVREVLAQTRQLAVQEAAKQTQAAEPPSVASSKLGAAKEHATVLPGMGGSTPGAGAEAASLPGSECQQEGQWRFVVVNKEFKQEGAEGEERQPAHLQEIGVLPSPLDLHSLKAELWHNVDQRCAAAEARCAAIVTAQAAAAQHSLEAMKLGLQGLQQEAAKLAVSEEHRAAAMLGAIDARADALQRQVDALEAIVQEALIPAQAMQEVRSAREECASGLAALDERVQRVEAQGRKMGDALLALARRMAELDPSSRKVSAS